MVPGGDPIRIFACIVLAVTKLAYVVLGVSLSRHGEPLSRSKSSVIVAEWDRLDMQAHRSLQGVVLGSGRKVPAHGFKYGFFMQVVNRSRAVEKVLENVRKHYPHERIIIFSDRSLNYTNMCDYYQCVFGLGGTKAGTWGELGSETIYLERMTAALQVCKCEFLIKLEEDACFNGPLEQEPPIEGDIGGVPWPDFPIRFKRYIKRVSGIYPRRPSVWGCTAGCYLRTMSVLPCFEKPGLFDPTSAEHQGLRQALGEPLQHNDVYPVAAAMVCGLSVVPWEEIAERDGNGLKYWSAAKRRIIYPFDVESPQPRHAIEHECPEMRKYATQESEKTLFAEVTDEDFDEAGAVGTLMLPLPPTSDGALKN